LADLEKLLQTVIFKPATHPVGQLLQEAADRIDTMEHLGALIEALLTKSDPRRFARRRHHWRKPLLADGVEHIIQRARKEAFAASRRAWVLGSGLNVWWGGGSAAGLIHV
jgi:hypothetical protein